MYTKLILAYIKGMQHKLFWLIVNACNINIGL